MRMVLIGPPGAGKGTQAEKLSAYYHIPRLTTGDLFRKAIQEKSPLGKKVKAILDQGSLVPDAAVLELMESRMTAKDCQGGFILDGFPRTEGQALGLDCWLQKNKLQLDAVVAISISKEEAILRNTGRRQCSSCGRAYHLRFNPPRQEGICDLCGGGLVQRSDDQEATVRKRLDVYQKETAPLLQFYQKKKLLKKTNGDAAPEAVFASIIGVVKNTSFWGRVKKC